MCLCLIISVFLHSFKIQIERKKDSFFQSRAFGQLKNVLNSRYSWIVVTELHGSENMMLEDQVLFKMIQVESTREVGTNYEKKKLQKILKLA